MLIYTVLPSVGILPLETCYQTLCKEFYSLKTLRFHRVLKLWWLFYLLPTRNIWLHLIHLESSCDSITNLEEQERCYQYTCTLFRSECLRSSSSESAYFYFTPDSNKCGYLISAPEQTSIYRVLLEVEQISTANSWQQEGEPKKKKFNVNVKSIKTVWILKALKTTEN